VEVFILASDGQNLDMVPASASTGIQKPGLAYADVEDP
jgi:hypothetical protein